MAWWGYAAESSRDDAGGRAAGRPDDDLVDGVARLFEADTSVAEEAGAVSAYYAKQEMCLGEGAAVADEEEGVARAVLLEAEAAVRENGVVQEQEHTVPWDAASARFGQDSEAPLFLAWKPILVSRDCVPRVGLSTWPSSSYVDHCQSYGLMRRRREVLRGLVVALQQLPPNNSVG